MMMKKAALTGLALTLLAVLACKPKTEGAQPGMTIKPGVLMVGAEVGYPPMEYFDEDGKTPIGFDIELAGALAKKLGLQVEIVDTSWDAIFAGVDTGKYDCIISSVTINPERQQKYFFPGAYISNAQAIVLPQGSSRTPGGMEELAGLKIAVQGETTSDEIMSELIAGGLEVELFRYDKVMNCFDELRSGRVDGVVCDSVVAYYYRANPNYTVNIVWEGAGEELGVCINKNNTALSKAVEEALDALFADGTVQGISQKIFGKDLVSSVR
ncbi:MAG: transporter substrate-binding domain-containing protein [Treponema sp.]|jgi:polar amino acid transport system substrate-binding protein|nr:transporter substrate-binding domain-containing protein [Treponema sp.]